MLFGTAWIRSYNPHLFLDGAGADDWQTMKCDKDGKVLFRPGTRWVVTDSDGCETKYANPKSAYKHFQKMLEAERLRAGIRIDGKAILVTDDYDESDAFAMLHRRVADHAAACRVIAKILEIEIEADKGRDAGKSGESEPPKKSKGKHLAAPSKIGIAAYRLYFISEVGTQKEVAEMLEKIFKRPVDQSNVSRWLKKVERWISAGNVLPDLQFGKRKRKTHPTDPTILERNTKA